MDRPQSVINATIAIVVSYFIGVLAVLSDKLARNISTDDFMFLVFIYGIFCILPYKIYNRSNAARVFYFVIIVLSILVSIGGGVEGVSPVHKISVFVTAPIDLLAVYWLLTAESSTWFGSGD